MGRAGQGPPYMYTPTVYCTVCIMCVHTKNSIHLHMHTQSPILDRLSKGVQPFFVCRHRLIEIFFIIVLLVFLVGEQGSFTNACLNNTTSYLLLFSNSVYLLTDPPPSHTQFTPRGIERRGGESHLSPFNPLA